MEQKPKRRWLRFTLRTMFILVAAVAIWLGWHANRVRKQNAAIAAIKELRGGIYFDWHDMQFSESPGLSEWSPKTNNPPPPTKFQTLIGEEYFQRVVHVTLPPGPVSESLLQHLHSLPHLKTVAYWAKERADVEELRESLPGITVYPTAEFYRQ